MELYRRMNDSKLKISFDLDGIMSNTFSPFLLKSVRREDNKTSIILSHCVLLSV